MSHQQDGLGSTARNRICNITGTQVQKLLAKLDVLLPFLPMMPLPLHEILHSNDFYTNGEASGGKHVFQEASILGHLRRIHALDESSSSSSSIKVVAIELGAGTARLSDRLQRFTNATLDHVLIDRQAFKPNQSRDRNMRARSRRKDSVTRVVVDIASLDLNEYYLAPNEQSTLCMSKHLCGEASDLALASMSRVSPPMLRPSCALATCCHYLCTWDSFVGKDFWKKLGLTEDDFVVCCAASQWASLDKKRSLEEATGNGTEIPETHDNNTDAIRPLPNLLQVAQVAAAALACAPVNPPLAPSAEFEKSFSKAEKGSLGIKLKQLLDLARAAQLQELGYTVELLRYTTRSIEDRLIVASMRI
jgi:tRNA:m4X modification enzyme